MHTERPRERRYPFVVAIELTEVQSEVKIRERTSDLNLFGCHVDTLKLLTPGTRIRIRIAHNGLIERAPEHLAHGYFPIKCAPPIKHYRLRTATSPRAQQ